MDRYVKSRLPEIDYTVSYRTIGEGEDKKRVIEGASLYHEGRLVAEINDKGEIEPLTDFWEGFSDLKASIDAQGKYIFIFEDNALVGKIYATKSEYAPEPKENILERIINSVSSRFFQHV